MPNYYFWNNDAQLVVPLAEYPTGTLYSNPVWPEPGGWEQFQINVWIKEVTGFPAEWVSVLETTPDEDTPWEEVPGSATPVIGEPGSRASNAQAPPGTLVRVKTTIAASGGTITGRAFVLVSPPLDPYSSS